MRAERHAGAAIPCATCQAENSQGAPNPSDIWYQSNVGVDSLILAFSLSASLSIAHPQVKSALAGAPLPAHTPFTPWIPGHTYPLVCLCEQPVRIPGQRVALISSEHASPQEA